MSTNSSINNNSTSNPPRLLNKNNNYDNINVNNTAHQPYPMSNTLPLHEQNLNRNLQANSLHFNKDTNTETHNHPVTIEELYRQSKLNPKHFFSRETLGVFLKEQLNLTDEKVKAFLEETCVKDWIDQNMKQGFVYESVSRREANRKFIRCDTCKQEGHLSHSCSVNELVAKITEDRSSKKTSQLLKPGASRCHICGSAGHFADICSFIICGFCQNIGHCSYMCSMKEAISRTLCSRCQSYGHTHEACPDRWRQFDRISTYEQSAFIHKPMLGCFQCGCIRHDGYNCFEYRRKYFIREFSTNPENTTPIYFFSPGRPFVRNSVTFNEIEKRQIESMVDDPIDTRFFNVMDEGSSDLHTFENFKNKSDNIASNNPSMELNDYIIRNNEAFVELNQFNETHNNAHLKEYIRECCKWIQSNVFENMLKYVNDTLPTGHIEYFLRNFPSRDFFILNWMWWTYKLNEKLERFSKDPFRSNGSTPWLILDNRIQQNYLDMTRSSDEKLENCKRNSDEKRKDCEKRTSAVYEKNINKIEANDKIRKMKNSMRQPAKVYYQYNQKTIEKINSLLFPNENCTNKSSHGQKNVENANKLYQDNIKAEGVSECNQIFELSGINKKSNMRTDIIDDNNMNTVMKQNHNLSKSTPPRRSKSCPKATPLNNYQTSKLFASSDEDCQTNDFGSESSCDNNPNVSKQSDCQNESKHIHKNKRQKLKDLEIKQIEESMSEHPQQLSHAYFKSSEPSLHNMSDSEGNIHKKLNNSDSHNSIKDCTIVDNTNIPDGDDDDEQNKTIVNEFGTAENDFGKSVKKTVYSEMLRDDNNTSKHAEQDENSDLRRQYFHENLNYFNNLLLPRIDSKTDLGRNDAIIVNSVSVDSIPQTAVSVDGMSVNSANNVFAKLFAPLSVNNSNDRNNNKIKNESLKLIDNKDKTNSCDNSKSSLLMLREDGVETEADNDSTSSELKERQRLDSTNYIKLLLKIDNQIIPNANEDEQKKALDVTVQQEAVIEALNIVTTEDLLDVKEDSGDALNTKENSQKTSQVNSSQSLRNNQSNSTKNQNFTQGQRSDYSKNRNNYQTESQYQQQPGYNNRKNYHYHQQRNFNDNNQYGPNNSQQQYNDNKKSQNESSFKNRRYGNNNQKQNTNYNNKENKFGRRGQKSTEGATTPILFTQSKSNDLCTVKNCNQMIASDHNPSVVNNNNNTDYKNSLTIITQQQEQYQQQQETFLIPSLFSNSSNSSSTSSTILSVSSASSLPTTSVNSNYNKPIINDNETSVYPLNNIQLNQQNTNESNKNSVKGYTNYKYGKYRRYDNSKNSSHNANINNGSDNLI